MNERGQTGDRAAALQNERVELPPDGAVTGPNSAQAEDAQAQVEDAQAQAEDAQAQAEDATKPALIEENSSISQDEPNWLDIVVRYLQLSTVAGIVLYSIGWAFMAAFSIRLGLVPEDLGIDLHYGITRSGAIVALALLATLMVGVLSPLGGWYRHGRNGDLSRFHGFLILFLGCALATAFFAVRYVFSSGGEQNWLAYGCAGLIALAFTYFALMDLLIGIGYSNRGPDGPGLDPFSLERAVLAATRVTLLTLIGSVAMAWTAAGVVTDGIAVDLELYRAPAVEIRLLLPLVLDEDKLSPDDTQDEDKLSPDDTQAQCAILLGQNDGIFVLVTGSGIERISAQLVLVVEREGNCKWQK